MLQAADPEHFDIFTDQGHILNPQVGLVEKELWCSDVALNWLVSPKTLYLTFVILFSVLRLESHRPFSYERNVLRRKRYRLIARSINCTLRLISGYCRRTAASPASETSRKFHSPAIRRHPPSALKTSTYKSSNRNDHVTQLWLLNLYCGWSAISYMFRPKTAIIFYSLLLH